MNESLYLEWLSILRKLLQVSLKSLNTQGIVNYINREDGIPLLQHHCTKIGYGLIQTQIF